MTYAPESGRAAGRGPDAQLFRPSIRHLPTDSGSVARNGHPAYRDPSTRAFWLGVGVGAVLAGAAALLLAPQSGADTREFLRIRALDARQRFRHLRSDVTWAGHEGRKHLQRGIRRGAWAAEDLMDRGRRRLNRHVRA